MRLINADKLKERIGNTVLGDFWFQTIVDLQETVDAEPVRHGHWIKMSDADGYYYACSECGNELTRIESFDPQFDLFPRLKSIDKTNYCPNCGAKMDFEEVEKCTSHQ